MVWKSQTQRRAVIAAVVLIPPLLLWICASRKIHRTIRIAVFEWKHVNLEVENTGPVGLNLTYVVEEAFPTIGWVNCGAQPPNALMTNYLKPSGLAAFTFPIGNPGRPRRIKMVLQKAELNRLDHFCQRFSKRTGIKLPWGSPEVCYYRAF